MSSQSRNPAPHRRAFTLVEVIVAGVITALVLGSMSLSISQLGRAKNTCKERLDAYLRADSALNALRSDIACIIRTDDLFYTRFLLYDDVINTPAGSMDRDELLIFNTRLKPVRNIDNFNGEGLEYETQYRIGMDDLGPVLWQRRDPLPDEYLYGGGMATPLVEGILGLAIEAYDGTEWFDEWDSDIVGLPLAVRVTIIASGHRDESDIFSSHMVTLRTVVPILRVLPPRDILEAEHEDIEEIEQEIAQIAQEALLEEQGDGEIPGIRPGSGPGSGQLGPGSGASSLSSGQGDPSDPSQFGGEQQQHKPPEKEDG